MEDLGTLLEEMDAHDWDAIKDYDHPGYETRAPERFREDLQSYGIELEGSVLDVACGPVSLAAVYDDVVASDYDPSMVKRLRENGVRAVIGDIRELPFDPDSFDYVVSFWPPGNIYEDPAEGVGKAIDDFFSIARDKVIIQSTPWSRHLPEKYDDYLELNDGRMVVYDVAAYKHDHADVVDTETYHVGA